MDTRRTRYLQRGMMALLLALGLVVSSVGTSGAWAESSQGGSAGAAEAWQQAPVPSILAAAPTVRLVVHITSTAGTVWGKVMLHYYDHHKRFNRVCTRRLCRLTVPRGVVVHLAQKPTNAASWPFQKWQIRVLLKGMKPRAVMKRFAAFKMMRNTAVTAVYVLHYAHW